MFRTIAEKQHELHDLCQQCHVETLYIFGSAAAENLDREPNDLDFLVKFAPEAYEEIFKCYFDLYFGLQNLYGREVDLVDETAMRNPYFIKEVMASRVPLYGKG